MHQLQQWILPARNVTCIWKHTTEGSIMFQIAVGETMRHAFRLPFYWLISSSCYYSGLISPMFMPLSTHTPVCAEPAVDIGSFNRKYSQLSRTLVLVNLSGGFGGPVMYVLSPFSTKPKYIWIKMENRKKQQTNSSTTKWRLGQLKSQWCFWKCSPKSEPTSAKETCTWAWSLEFECCQKECPYQKTQFAKCPLPLLEWTWCPCLVQISKNNDIWYLEKSNNIWNFVSWNQVQRIPYTIFSHHALKWTATQAYLMLDPKHYSFFFCLGNNNVYPWITVVSWYPSHGI